MTLPKYYEYFTPILRFLSDGQLHTPKELREYLIKEMKLTNEDVTEMLPSGKITYFYDRVGWVRTYLNKAGLIDTPSRAKYRITDEGVKALESGETIDLDYLDKYDSFRAFKSKGRPNLQSLLKKLKMRSLHRRNSLLMHMNSFKHRLLTNYWMK